MRHPARRRAKAPILQVAATNQAGQIEPGMVVDATQGDLGGGDDISQAKVKDVARDDHGDVERVVIEKGVVFRKTIEVPVERVRQVEQAGAADETTTDANTQPTGAVTIAVSEPELDSLHATGAEELPPKQLTHPDDEDLLDEVEERLPTEEGLRQKEGERIEATQFPAGTGDANSELINKGAQQHGWRAVLHILGPGLLAGMAGNDASAIASYAVVGATMGYNPLWLILLATPLLQAVQYASAKIGRVTQRGLADLLTFHYGRRVALPAALLLVVANVALIAADLVAIGTGLQLLTGLNWVWFVVPVAVTLWYTTVYQNFGTLKKIFLTLSLVFVAYLVTGLFSGAHWGLVLTDTVVPHLSLSFVGISGAVALLGATISPYTIFWQMQGEKEEKRAGSLRRQTHAAAADIGMGVFSGNLVAYFVIVCAAATLFTHHETITTAADAARSLQPLLGPYATYLFALGFIGAGLIAIPVLLASTSYGVAGTIGWAASLWRKPWQNEGFYLILTAALVASLALALLRIDPITLIFWANILQGILSPALVVLLAVLGRSRRLMGAQRLGWLTLIGLIAAAALLTVASLLLFYSLFTGQGG